MGDFNAPLIIMATTIRQKIRKQIEDTYDTISQLNLTDVHRTFHLTKTEYTFFLRARGIFFKTDHMLGHKLSLDRFKKISYKVASLTTT